MSRSITAYAPNPCLQGKHLFVIPCVSLQVLEEVYIPILRGSEPGDERVRGSGPDKSLQKSSQSVSGDLCSSLATFSTIVHELSQVFDGEIL